MCLFSRGQQRWAGVRLPCCPEESQGWGQLETAAMLVSTFAFSRQDGASMGFLVLASTTHFFTFKEFPPFLMPYKGRRGGKKI